MTCPTCGHQNQPGDKFCANCGERLEPRFQLPQQFPEDKPPVPAPPPGSSEPPAEAEAIPEDSADPEWRMSPLPPPPPPKRRVWLWVLVGLVLFCVLLVCGFGVYLTTDSGQNFLNDLATRAAEVATEAP